MNSMFLATLLNFTYSLWIYIKDWQYRYGEKKVIFTRQKAGETDHYTEVSLAGSTNTLNVSMASGNGLCGSGGTNCHSVGIENMDDLKADLENAFKSL